MNNIKMSTKKKAVTKTPEPKPKYAVGQKVFAIWYHRGKPEELCEVEIVTRTTREYDEKDYMGKKSGKGFSFLYTAKTASVPMNLLEGEIYPNYIEAAKVFAKSFLTLLK